MSKIAIITGGSRGIGKSISLRLAKLGHNIVINHVSPSSAKLAQEVIETAKNEYGVDGLVVQGNVAEYADCQRIVNSAVEKFGENIQVLVNNAGIEKSGSFIEKTPEEYSNVINVNLLSPMHCSHLVLPYMIKQKSGNIINIASIASYMPMGDNIDYAASKSGVLGLTRSLAQLGAPYGIRVNAIAPGATKTDMMASVPKDVIDKFTQTIPLQRISSPEEMADCAEYFLNAKSITGQVISPNGGVWMD